MKIPEEVTFAPPDGNVPFVAPEKFDSLNTHTSPSGGAPAYTLFPLKSKFTLCIYPPLQAFILLGLLESEWVKSSV
jgi:hypothetical protein